MLKNPLKTLIDALINRFTKERLETLILQNDEKLLTFMLEDKNANDYKNAFFKTIANSLVFNQKALLECLTKELENSFTRFENKIGLYLQGDPKRPIKSSESVVLNFPFKDNVLLGNAKDNSTKSKECFYHEILHKKEIDTLLKKKVLCRFEMHGEGDLESALKDKNTNYLIKGNNLIALHSLKKKFAKQIKCIYIDPPYNTGNDSFNYNDNFNHSSWLVFMKNRLEIAREFLSDDGVIFVQCDDNEQAYLKVLMDEIFIRENFVGCCPICVNPRGRQSDKFFPNTHDYFIAYAKNITNFYLNGLCLNDDWTKEINKQDDKGKYREIGLRKRGADARREDSPKLYFPIFYNKQTHAISLEKTYGDLIEIIPKLNDGIDGRWRWSKDKIIKDMDKLLVRLVNNERYDIFEKDYLTQDKRRKQKSLWLDKDFNNELGGLHIKNLFNNKIFAYPKSEHLIQRILEVSTNENDLVLDFFAGSGTTCAVAHKMKRRYIGIEQMDYIETITKERLKKVIEGEQGGISKKCGFKGGGSFVYAELKEVNLEIKKQILNAKSASECLKIFNASERILKRTDCKMDEIHSEEFQNLDLNEQKRIYCALLDFNEDYLSLGDIDEDAWGIDGITKKYNEIFYS
ncbi:site-specific DNA-methyltransferase [Helicobacter pylori]